MPKAKKIHITPSEYRTLALLLQRYIPHTQVWAYGSRTQEKTSDKSDLDLVAFTTNEQKSAFYDLKEALEESDLPFRVDFFQWNELPEHFQKKIQDYHIVLQHGK